jgi:hypothetical protein
VVVAIVAVEAEIAEVVVIVVVEAAAVMTGIETVTKNYCSILFFIYIIILIWV